MHRRLLWLAVALAAFLASAGAATAGTPSYPVKAAIATGPRFVADSTLSARKARALLASPSYWGGRYRTAAGELVTVYLSDSYSQDPAVGQRWADFLGSLVHGAELGLVTVFLAPLSEVQTICGAQALACFDPSRSLVVTPGEAPASDLTAEAILTHEYGHHVAGHRSNAPWAAIDYGTKRWASLIQVCRRARTGSLKPGAEDLPNYFLNPGEGFAESYRVLNQRKAGLVESPWEIVSRSLYPSADALVQLEQDVTAPWTTAAATTYRGSVSSRSRTRRFSFATALDGAMRIDLRASSRVRLRLQITNAAGTSVAKRTVAAGRSSTVATTICGQRGYSARITRIRGAGAFALSVTRP
jgi:hypothetical protein